MKQLIILLALIIGLQADTFAQHYKRMQPVRKHRKAPRHRSHRRVYYRSSRHTADRAAVRREEPSPYRGDNTPINDGQRKNKQRNLNYNTNQALPPSTGGR
jgi:hypothetical protein